MASDRPTAVASPRPAKRARGNEDDTVEVLVGEEQTKFIVEKNLITKASPFFRAALERDFKEAHEQRVRLPECEAAIFEIYLRWLEKGHVTSDGIICAADPDELIELYVFGDRLGDVGLCNRAADYLLWIWYDDGDLQPSNIKQVYASTPDQSRLRRLAVDCFIDRDHQDLCSCICLENDCDRWRCDYWTVQWIWCGRIEMLDEGREDLPPDFIFDVARASMVAHHRVGVEHPRDRGKCYYHEHNDEVPEAECVLIDVTVDPPESDDSSESGGSSESGD